VGISIGGGIVGGGGGGGIDGLFKFVVNDCVVVVGGKDVILEFGPRIPAGSSIAILDLLCLILVVVSLIGVDSSSSSFEFMLFSEFIVSDKLSSSESGSELFVILGAISSIKDSTCLLSRFLILSPFAYILIISVTRLLSSDISLAIFVRPLCWAVANLKYSYTI
jgi:hypothetical protein